MPASFQPLFRRLRDILVPHAAELSVEEDSPTSYGLVAPVGPTTVAIWGGKLRQPLIPVASVRLGKAYVSFHLMPLYGQSPLQKSLSPELAKRLHGKTCFDFKAIDEPLFAELAAVTARGIAAYRKAGYIA